MHKDCMSKAVDQRNLVTLTVKILTKQVIYVQLYKYIYVCIYMYIIYTLFSRNMCNKYRTNEIHIKLFLNTQPDLNEKTKRLAMTFQTYTQSVTRRARMEPSYIYRHCVQRLDCVTALFCLRATLSAFL